METLVAATGHASRFWPSGGTVDIMRGGRVVSSHIVVLSVWRSDETTKLYLR